MEAQTVEMASNVIHPVVARLLKARGIAEDQAQQFLNPHYESDVHDPFLFAHMERVIARIAQAKEKKEKIMIFGDYDADGVTSSAILREALLDFGLEVAVYIPDKKSEGYGMNEAAVERFAQQEINIIITVDCGITNVSPVATANKLGMDVIIVDHHHVPQELPEAFAIINPHQEGCGYPFAELAGVGVVFKVVQALYTQLMPEKQGQTKWMLDLVAIGTVADCVPLIGENRVLVKYGLLVLSKTRRIGLQQLMQVGRIVIEENTLPDTKKISFQIAPRINAAGRIDHANLAYNLVVEQDAVHARTYALELEANNLKRQQMTEQVSNEIRVLAENMFKDKKFIFAVGEHFPIGIVGLVAGKIAQQFNKPTAILQKGELATTGSFRSIPQINIIETIEQSAALLKKFGGHSQAAGITVSNENLEALYDALNESIEKQLAGKDLTPELCIDAEIKPMEIDFSLIDGLEKMKPFGEGNGEPVFLVRNLKVVDVRWVGNGSKHLKLSLQAQDGSPKIFDAIGFYKNTQFADITAGIAIDLVCTLQADEWNGSKKIQLNIVDMKEITP